MSIVLLVLKIIGITLLAILGLGILIVLLVLFVPVRYMLDVNKNADDDFCINLKIHWLLHFVRIFINYYSELSYRVKVLFFTIYKSDNLITEKEKKRAEKKELRKKYINQAGDADATTDSGACNASENAVVEKSENVIDSPDEANESATLNNESIEDESGEDREDNKKTFIDRILFVLEKLIDIIFNINDKIFAFFNKVSDIWDNLDYYVDMINDEHNRAAVDICFDRIKVILSDIKPRKIRGNIHIGSDDPYTIGKMMSIYSILLPIIRDKIQMVPDYEQEIIEGQLILKGHATVYKLIKLLYVYYFNKDVKRLKKIYICGRK